MYCKTFNLVLTSRLHQKYQTLFAQWAVRCRHTLSLFVLFVNFLFRSLLLLLLDKSATATVCVWHNWYWMDSIDVRMWCNWSITPSSLNRNDSLIFEWTMVLGEYSFSLFFNPRMSWILKNVTNIFFRLLFFFAFFKKCYHFVIGIFVFVSGYFSFRCLDKIVNYLCSWFSSFNATSQLRLTFTLSSRSQWFLINLHLYSRCAPDFTFNSIFCCCCYFLSFLVFIRRSFFFMLRIVFHAFYINENHSLLGLCCCFFFRVFGSNDFRLIQFL